MGVEFEDAIKVGSLLGTKVFVDEFVSFKQLGKMVENGEIQVCRVIESKRTPAGRPIFPSQRNFQACVHARVLIPQSHGAKFIKHLHIF